MSETETSTNAVTTNAVAAANGLDAESQSTGRDKAIAVLKALNKSPAPTIAEKPEEMPVNPSPDATETPAAEETTEVKASPEAELKARLRAKAAAQEARERELEAKFAAREKELSDRASAMEAQSKSFNDALENLRRMAQNDPSKFLEQTGVDLNGLVKAKLIEGKPEAVAERALRELAEFRAAVEKERAEERQRSAEAQQNAARQAQENEFLSLAKPETHPALARLAKKNPALAIQNAYLISGMMQRESGGKLPEIPELVKRVDAELRALLEDDAPPSGAPLANPATPGKLTAKKAAVPAATKEIGEMSESEKRKEAMRIVREFRKASQSG
jgi:hypothetical protein